MCNRSPVYAVAALLLSTASLCVAQSFCPNASGQWTDSYGYQWNVIQPPAGYGALTGSVYIAECGNTWAVSGSTQATSRFSVRATNPGTGNISCVDEFLYTGHNLPNGCNTGSGTWTNFSGNSGNFTWGKPCDLAASEYSVDQGPSNVSPDHVATHFLVVLQPGPAVLALEGHGIREQVLQAQDQCWFPGSAFLPYTSGGALGSGVVNSANQYADDVGLAKAYVDYYRSQGRVGCAIVVPQQVQLGCNYSSNGWTTYRTNTLRMQIGATVVWNTRDGVTGTISYP
jgi:hypothetical protein